MIEKKFKRQHLAIRTASRRAVIIYKTKNKINIAVESQSLIHRIRLSRIRMLNDSLKMHYSINSHLMPNVETWNHKIRHTVSQRGKEEQEEAGDKIINKRILLIPCPKQSCEYIIRQTIEVLYHSQYWSYGLRGQHDEHVNAWRYSAKSWYREAKP